MTAGALATSGDYRNFYLLEGRRVSHTLDPRTGSPVIHALASASVLFPDATSADAYATALMVLGPDQGLRFASARHLAALFLVYNAEGGIDERMTPAFEEFLARGGGRVLEPGTLDVIGETAPAWPSS